MQRKKIIITRILYYVIYVFIGLFIIDNIYVDFTINLIALVIMIYFSRQLLYESFFEFFGGVKKVFNNLWIVFFSFFIAFTLKVVIMMSPLLEKFTNLHDESIDEGMTTVGGDLYWIMYLVVLAPITEELIYRGVIFAGLKKRSKILAYVVSILMFSLIHVVFEAMSEGWGYLLVTLEYVPMSIALAYVYDKTNSIYSSMLLHMLNNFLAVYAVLL